MADVNALDAEIEKTARDLIALVTRRNGQRTGRYALIAKAVVDDPLGNGVMSWDWYWNPDTSQEGDGH